MKLSDAPRGVTERTLRLSGHPEQVQAAVNLVQVIPPLCFRRDMLRNTISSHEDCHIAFLLECNA